MNELSLNWCEDANHPDWDLWDEYLQETPRGHYLQLSDWLKAYSVYGFDAALLVGKASSGQIVGGLGLVKAGVAFVKMYIVPAGPIIREGWERTTEQYIRSFYDYAKRKKAAYAHINVPILKEGEMPFSLPQNALPDDSIFYSGTEGIKFKNVATISGLRWVNLEHFNKQNPEQLLASLPSKVRRDIRASQRKNLEYALCQEYIPVKKAYEAIEQAAVENGYVVRSWDDIHVLINKLLEKKYSVFLTAEKEGESKGAIWLIKCGKRYTYMTGGAKREIPDLLTGYSLQWNALITSLEEGFQGYDISVGGSPGVLKFKNSFNPVYYPFTATRHWIFNRWKFFLFELFYHKLSKYKTTVASILRRFTKQIK